MISNLTIRKYTYKVIIRVWKQNWNTCRGRNCCFRAFFVLFSIPVGHVGAFNRKKSLRNEILHIFLICILIPAQLSTIYIILHQSNNYSNTNKIYNMLLALENSPFSKHINVISNWIIFESCYVVMHGGFMPSEPVMPFSSFKFRILCTSDILLYAHWLILNKRSWKEDQFLGSFPHSLTTSLTTYIIKWGTPATKHISNLEKAPLLHISHHSKSMNFIISGVFKYIAKYNVWCAYCVSLKRRSESLHLVSMHMIRI